MSEETEGQIYDYQDTLTFGKHKGQTIRWLLDNHPDYLAWCLDNVEDFQVTDEVDEELEILLWSEDDGYEGTFGY